jgi:DNA polymerase III subunit epsilon
MPPLISPHALVADLPLTFVDVETTGLDIDAGDRVCEVALLRVQRGQEVRRWSSLVQPGRSMPPRATAINGITDQMLATAPRFDRLVSTLSSQLCDTVFIAHNAQFDVRSLRHEFSLAQRQLPLLAVVDTLALAQAWYRFPHNSLQAIAEAFGLNNTVRHRALADVLTTWQIWQRFMAEREINGPLTLMHVMHPHDRRSAVELELLTTTMHTALDTHQRLFLHYRASNAEETQRTVLPLELQYERGHAYLRAYCHMRQEERHFRLDRIMALELSRDHPAPGD